MAPLDGAKFGSNQVDKQNLHNVNSVIRGRNEGIKTSPGAHSHNFIIFQNPIGLILRYIDNTGYKHMKQFLLAICLIFIGYATTSAQTSRLALQYFETGEFEKAAALFQELYEKDRRSNFYFDKYIESLLAMEAFGEAEQVVDRRLRKEKDNLIREIVTHWAVVKNYRTVGFLINRN